MPGAGACVFFFDRSVGTSLCRVSFFSLFAIMGRRVSRVFLPYGCINFSSVASFTCVNLNAHFFCMHFSMLHLVSHSLRVRVARLWLVGGQGGPEFERVRYTVCFTCCCQRTLAHACMLCQCVSMQCSNNLVAASCQASLVHCCASHLAA